MITETRSYEKDGKKYEIRIENIGNGFKVRAFLNAKPVNPITYSVSIDTAMDFSSTHGDVLETLVALAIADL